MLVKENENCRRLKNRTLFGYNTSFVKFAGYIFFREFTRLSDWLFLKFKMQLSYASMSFPAVICYGGRKVTVWKCSYVAVRTETHRLDFIAMGLHFLLLLHLVHLMRFDWAFGRSCCSEV